MTLGIGLAAGGWIVYRAASRSLQAENTLHATILAVQLVEQFVRDNGRWPTSWKELEETQAPTQVWRWPADSAEIQKRVFIDFQARPQQIAAQDPMSFEAIKPIGPYFEYRDYHYVPSLQAAIRESLKGSDGP